MKYFPLLAIVFTAVQHIEAMPSPNTNMLPREAPFPTLDQFLAEVDSVTTRRDLTQPRHVVQRQAAFTNSTSPAATNATVELCTEPQFAGECVNSTWPVNTCIALNGYAGAVRSIDPKQGFECLLTQGRCNVATPYISVGSDPSDTAGDDLSSLAWIEDSSSYICFTEIELLRRFVTMRLRAPVRDAEGFSVTAE
ncbi:hypothetical protein CERZMDRAFT_93733 [Cercospora zeae-maydis SCOH1-5]|uniref:Uncharacterized protein n=1 Tax=Cercospora zeae-maydis SCOH1-5 TaxID=717836 RepID=A0A6A6FTD0_9PEZI|nr:hypothetical protein CERZMDRAFT_93733 [Cercospora zeae-maydis SCOH1-5]